MRHIDGKADGSLAPALAVNKAACFSAAASASDPVTPLEPTASKRAYNMETSAKCYSSLIVIMEFIATAYNNGHAKRYRWKHLCLLNVEHVLTVIPAT
jgi:hypothetical protein